MAAKAKAASRRRADSAAATEHQKLTTAARYSDQSNAAELLLRRPWNRYAARRKRTAGRRFPGRGTKLPGRTTSSAGIRRCERLSAVASITTRTSAAATSRFG